MAGSVKRRRRWAGRHSGRPAFSQSPAPTTVFASGERRSAAEPKERIVVVQVHRQGLVRAAWAAILARERRIVVAASAATVEEAIGRTPVGGIEVALIEGVPTTIRAARLHLPGSRIVALWDPQVRAGPAECTEAGARGFLPWEAGEEDLLASVLGLGRSEGPKGRSRGSGSPDRAGEVVPEVDRLVLSEREREILQAVAAGYSRERIARKLGISLSTVRFHLRRACERLGAASRAQAVAIAWRLGMLGFPEARELAAA